MTKSHGGAIVDVIPKTFEAVLDEQPGPGRTHRFHATVEIEAEVDWKVELVSAVPQGVNAFDKLLRVHVTKPHGPHSDAIAKRTLRYDESPAQVDYTHATLEDGTQLETVKVRLVV